MRNVGIDGPSGFAIRMINHSLAITTHETTGPVKPAALRWLSWLPRHEITCCESEGSVSSNSSSLHSHQGCNVQEPVNLNFSLVIAINPQLLDRPCKHLSP